MKPTLMPCLVIWAVFLLLLRVETHAVEENSARPNIVFILLDNVGREWFGCYGSEEHCTPQIDKIAQGGVRFTNCYTTVVCGPSRVQLLTGRYPHRTGWNWHHDAALYSGGGLDPKREVTIARALRDAGYATGIAGKWQVNNLYDEPDVLARHGFDETLVWPGSIDRDLVDAGFMQKWSDAITRNDADWLAKENRFIESRYWNPVVLRDGRRERLAGKFGPDVFAEFAHAFVKKKRDRPFFLYWPMVLTHGQNFLEKTVLTPDNRATPPADEKQKFAAMLRYADRQVGQFFAALDQSGLRDNTIVFVASDNGTEKSLGARANGRVVQGGLYQINEAGGNVPLMVNCPKRIAGGRVASLADFTDILPTICDLTDAPPPKGVKLDGQSFAAFLRGEGSAPREWIFNEYSDDRVVRDERFKLTGKGQLYDLDTDPDEQQPLAADTPARRKLQAVLNAMPPVTPLPFPHRSLSAFKARQAQNTAAAVSLEFVLEFGGKGEGKGQFRSPIGIAINERDEIFVNEFNGDRVQKFDVQGKWLAGFSVLKHPSGIAVNREGLIFVSSMTEHRIDVHDADGKLIRSIGRKGAADGEFNQPGALLIAPDGTLLVADQCNHRVQRFGVDGKFLGKFGSYGSAPGQFGGADRKGSRFGGPHFLAWDRDGHLWTTESKNGRIQKLTADGKPLLHWGSNQTGPGGFGGREAAERTPLPGPIGVVVDAQQRVWISSTNDRVQCFTEQGQYLGGITESGPKPGQLHLPHGMVFDSQGFLFVVDASNQRVQKFKVRDTGWRELPLITDGKITDGWAHLGWGQFTVDGGALRTDCDERGMGLLFYTKEKFGDCQLRVVYRCEKPKSNAGVYVRLDDGILGKVGEKSPEVHRDAKTGRLSKEMLKVLEDASNKHLGAWYPVHHGYEVQIMDATDEWHRTGAIYSLAKAAELPPASQDAWRTLIITLDGEKIRAEVDGRPVSDFDAAAKDLPPRVKWAEPIREIKRPPHGHIGLQNHDPGDVVWFKEVSVRPLHVSKH